MFNNPGKKIKTFAVVVFWIGCTFAFLSFFACQIIGTVEHEPGTMILGLVSLILSPLFSWISSLLLYGFGQLIDNSDKLVKNTDKLVDNPETPTAPDWNKFEN